jgi:hypothetical protein
VYGKKKAAETTAPSRMASLAAPQLADGLETASMHVNL